MTRVSAFRGVAAFLVVSAVLAGCGAGAVSDEDGPASQRSAGPAADVIAEQPSAETAAESATTERKIVINSNLQIEVEKLAAAYESVASIARLAGGFVAESSLSGGTSAGGASLRLRVPASEHDNVVRQIRAVGLRVLMEATDSKEVTEEYTDLDARLRNLQRTEAQYQQFLGQARTLDEVLNVSNRLDAVRGQIEQAQGRIRLLDNLNDFATVAVALVLPAPKAERSTPEDVLVSSWQASTQIALAFANVLAATVVLLLWLLVLAPFGLLGLRFGRRLAPVARRLIDW